MAMTDSLIPSVRAIAVALFRNISPPKISPASPPAIITPASHNAIGFLVTSACFTPFFTMAPASDAGIIVPPAAPGMLRWRLVVRIMYHISPM